MNNANNYIVRNTDGVVSSKNGLPWQPRLFCDDRLMVEINNNSISEIRFFNEKASGSNIVFRRNFLKPTGFYLEDEICNYELEPHNIKMLPFGFCGECIVDKCCFNFSIYTVDNNIFIIIKTPHFLNKDYNYHFEIRKNAFFVPQNVEKEFNNPQLSGGDRKWGEFLKDKQFYKASYKENDAFTYMSMTSNSKAVLRVTARNTKYDFYFKNIVPDTEYVWAISFASNEAVADANCSSAILHYKDIINKTIERYKKVFDNIPKFNSGNVSVDNFMHLAPLYNESLKVKSIPGIIRANTKHYFAWGSDSLLEANSLYFWGDNEYNEQIMKVAVDRGFPLVCAYGNDGSNVHKNDNFIVGQNIVFINYLYCYVSGGGKLSDELYNFAELIFNKTMMAYDEKSGMFATGARAEFDYSSLFKTIHMTDEVYGFKENIQIYIALRSMQVLAYIKGNIETVDRITNVVESVEKNFDKVFFDKVNGYYSLATDGKTGEKSNMFSPYLSRVENEFLSDIISNRYREITEYMKKNFVSQNGIRPINKNDESYDGDANQMHSWWPAYNSDYYMRCIEGANDRELMDKFVGWVSFWSERLTIPEGIDCYCDNKNPDFDDWNMCCGAWQLYNYRAFYQSIVRGLYGLDFDSFGATVFSHSYENISIKGLHAMGRDFDFKTIGAGDCIESIIVNGVVLKGTNRIPYDILGENNSIVVRKTEEASQFPKIIRFTAAKVTNYLVNDSGISCNVEIPGHAVLVIAGKCKTVLLNGHEAYCEDERNNTVVRINGMGTIKIDIISE